VPGRSPGRHPVVHEPRRVGVAEVVEPQPADLVPRDMLHGLRVRPVPLGVRRTGLVRPPRLEPAGHGDDLAEHPGPHERRSPDPRPEQGAPQRCPDLVGEGRCVARRGPAGAVLADDRDEPGRSDTVRRPAADFGSGLNAVWPPTSVTVRITDSRAASRSRASDRSPATSPQRTPRAGRGRHHAAVPLGDRREERGAQGGPADDPFAGNQPATADADRRDQSATDVS